MLDSAEGVAARTLEWCNEIRRRKGLDPLDRLPRGRVKDPHSCPCGKATGLFVDKHHYGVRAEMAVEPLPYAVAMFVRYFDAGSYPDLIERVDEPAWP